LKRILLFPTMLALWGCVGLGTSEAPDASSPAGIPAAPTAAVGIVVTPPPSVHKVGASYPSIPTPATQAEGDLLAYHTGLWNGLAPGTNGFVLTSTGTSSLPTWQAAGAGASVTGTGLWHSTSGTLDAAAFIGTAAQIPVTNAGATNTPWVTVSGDCTLAASGALTCTKLNSTSYGAGGALTTGNSAYVSGASATTYQALNLAGGSGWVTGVLPTGNQANQALVGDVTGNTGADTVVALQGFGVATATPTSNQVLTWNSGTSKWTATTPASAPSVTGSGVWHSTSGTLDSAASHGSPAQLYVTNSGGTDSSWVTMSGDATLAASGALTLGNFSLAGDVTGTKSATIVSAISGTSPIAITPNTFQWIQGATGPGLSQAQQANGSNPASFTITPQAPGGGAGSTPTGTPGNLNVALAAPVSTGSEAYLQVTRGGTPMASLGTLSVYGGLWLGNAAPTASNYSIWGFGNNTYLGAGGGSVIFRPSNTSNLGMVGTTGWQFGAESLTLGGGSGGGVIGITNATTNPTATCSGGLCLSSNGGNLEVDSGGLQFPKFISAPLIKQNAQTTDLSAQNIGVQAQNAWASAATHVTGGNATFAGGLGTTLANGGSSAILAGDGTSSLTAAAAGAGVSGSLNSSILFNSSSSTLTADVAPQGVGAPNSQNLGSQKKRIFCRTNATGIIACGGFAFTVPSNTVASFTVRWTARDVTSNNNANDATGMCVAAVHNQSGTLNGIGPSAGSCTSVWSILGTGNTTSAAFTYTMAGSTVRFNMGGYTITDNIDWTLDVDMTLN
jgi:trimeric autotransporter adhesin